MPAVVNLRTGVELTFVSISPRGAVVCAYAQQERKDFVTGGYAKYQELVEESQHFYFLEDWGVAKSDPEDTHG